MYTYVGRGLGGFFGWLMAWAFLLAEPLVAPALYAAFGLYGSIVLAYFGITGQFMWIPGALICGAVVWFLTYRGIGVSTGPGSCSASSKSDLRAHPGAPGDQRRDRNTASVFIPGDDGLTPALTGMVFSLLAFVGFEAAHRSARGPRSQRPFARRCS
jgi:amino acid transporter